MRSQSRNKGIHGSESAVAAEMLQPGRPSLEWLCSLLQNLGAVPTCTANFYFITFFAPRPAPGYGPVRPAAVLGTWDVWPPPLVLLSDRRFRGNALVLHSIVKHGEPLAAKGLASQGPNEGSSTPR